MDSSYTTTTMTTDSSSLDPSVMAGVFLFFIIAALVGYVFYSWLLGRIFKKAGRPAWEAWVPFLNNWRFFEIGDQPAWISLLSIIPGVNIVAAVFAAMAAYGIGKHLGKDGVYVVLFIFLSPIWTIILAFDRSTWDSNQALPATPIQG